MGDLLLTTPLARAFHLAGWSVEMVAPEWLLPLFENNPNVAAAHAIETIAPGFPKEWRLFARWLRVQRYEMILLPNANERHQLFASLISGIRRRYAMWSGVWGRLTMHHCVRSAIRERPRAFADILLDLARAAGVPPDGTKLDLVVTAEEIGAARSWLQGRGFDGTVPLVGIHPGCAGNSCNLPSRVYCEVAEQVLARGQTVVVATGSEKDVSLMADWTDRVRESKRFINGVGELSLRQLAAVISQFSVYIVPSTGPLHLASALGTATVSAFCPLAALTPIVWGNQNENGHTISPSKLACETWRRANPSASHCDFRGEVTAFQIANRVFQAIGGR
jgi:ADP-heptose:LPS heptosyltransferase